MFRFRRLELVTVAALAIVSAAATWLLPERPTTGFVGRYWDNTSWDGAPRTVTRSSAPTTSDILASAPWASAGFASAEWTGVFTLSSAGRHTFSVRSDDGAWLWVDDTLVVDNGGTHGEEERGGEVDLEAGVHRVRVRHFQAGGGLALAVTWSRPGGVAEAITASSVAPDREAASAGHPPAWLRRGVVVLPFVWSLLLLYLPVKVLGAWMSGEVSRAAPNARDRASLKAVMVLAAGLLVWGIEWGARGDAWNPDELRPNVVRDALSQRFVGGWHDKYPAMHYIALGLPLVAFETADRRLPLPPEPMDAHVAQVLVTRLVSTLLGLGALAAAFICGAELFGARRAVLAPLALLLTPLFVFYGKLANLDVPSLCWFGWALVGFLRVVRGGDRAAYILLGAAAAAAVATKDQAYASLALLVPVVVWSTARSRRETGWPARIAGAFVDPRMGAGFTAAVVVSLVCHNVVFNPSGFVAHLRLLASFNDIAIVPRNAAGAWELTWRTGDLFRWSMGWPLVMLAGVGIVRAAMVPERRWWLWLLLVPVSFHATFTLVTYFVCDRYVFPGVFVLALFAGASMADLLSMPGRRALGRAIVGVALLWSLLWAASINAMMNLDGREVARAWVQARVQAREGRGAVVGLVGNYLPYFAPPSVGVPLASTEDVAGRAPRFIVVNERYAWRYRSGRPSTERQLLGALEGGELGYAEVFRNRASVPGWALLQYDAAFRGRGESWWTNLDKVNPEVVVYERTP